MPRRGRKMSHRRKNEMRKMKRRAAILEQRQISGNYQPIDFPAQQLKRKRPSDKSDGRPSKKSRLEPSINKKKDIAPKLKKGKAVAPKTKKGKAVVPKLKKGKAVTPKIKKGKAIVRKADRIIAVGKYYLSSNSNFTPVAAIPLRREFPMNENGELIFACASCQYQSQDEQEFMKHTRAGHHRDLSIWCRECDKCFINASLLVLHIKERACIMEDMIYRCGVKDCTFKITCGQTFVYHLRHSHKGSPFLFCVHCQKLFTLPHFLVLHMQNECPYKEKNRRSKRRVTTPPATPNLFITSFPSFTPIITSVTSGADTQPIMPATTVIPQFRGRLTPSFGRGELTPSSCGHRDLFPSSCGTGRGSTSSENNYYNDPDDPSWKPEELTGQFMQSRSVRFAKKVNDVVNVQPKSTSRGLTSEELNSEEVICCPCCDYLAAFKSMLQDHYIALHKVTNKNACLVCHLKFESTQSFLDHFEDHINGKLPNSISVESPITVQEDSNSRTEIIAQPAERVILPVENIFTDSQSAEKIILDEDLLQGVVKNISKVNVIDLMLDDFKFIKIPYQAAIQDKSSKDAKLKKFEKFKSPNDLVAMRSVDKLKCFYKCVMYSCTYTSNDHDEFSTHVNTMHQGKILHCNYCLKELYSGEVLVQHMMAEHSKRQFQCSNCFYRACSIKHVKIHIQHHHNKDTSTVALTCDPVEIAVGVTVSGEPTENTTWPYICAIGDCVFQSFDPQKFKIHNETLHHSVSVFFCYYCKVDFQSLKRLLNHYRVHGINAMQCNYCIYGSETKEDVLLHLCNSHADHPMTAFKRGLAEETSSSMTLSLALPFSNNIANANINNTSLEAARSESPLIEIVDNNLIDFEAQLYEVVGETYYPKYLKGMATDFVCGIPFCQMKFESVLMYIAHLSNHHAAVNFPCPHCPHISDDWDNFKNHLMCHGPELFACGLVTCNFYDWNKNIAMEHLKSHSQTTAKVVIVREEPQEDTDIDKIKFLPQSYSAKLSGTSYQCLFCRYKSREKSIMKKHLYKEMMYKRFSCNSCDENYTERKEIKDHYIEQHSDQNIKCSVRSNFIIENAVQQFLDLNVLPPETKADQCENCKKKFNTIVHLQRHVYLCTRQLYQPYDCNYCKSSFPDIKLLKFHIDKKHFRKPFMFQEISSHLVEDALALKLQHVRLKYLKEAVNSENCTADNLPVGFVKFYICSICSFESNHKHNIHTHIENKHKDLNVEITKMLRNVDMPDLSESLFPNTPKDNSTALPLTTGKAKPYRCGICIKRMRTLADLDNHVESMHSDQDESEYMFYYFPDPQMQILLDDKQSYECSYCKSVKDNLVTLKKHSDLMHSESPFRVRGFVQRNSTCACAYCFQRLANMADLMQHTTTLHPSLAHKSIGGFKRKPEKRENEDSDSLPNKRVRFSSLIFICLHCGASYSTKEQVTVHSKKGHTRLQMKFTTMSPDEEECDRRFYKCEFCQFTSEQDFLDMHLKTKHKNRLTCGYCNKRYEFASKLKEHHDGAHEGLPVKYSQETLPFIKKGTLHPESNPVVNVPSNSKASSMSPKQLTKMNGIYVTTYGISDCPSKLLLSSFSQIYNIYPKVIMMDIMQKK